MSIPSNPLNRFNTSTFKHMLVAFKYTEDAEQTNISPSLGSVGSTFTGKGAKGPGIVIVNEFDMSDFIIYSAKWSLDFYGTLTKTCASCVGTLEITDRTGLHFIDFMKTTVVPKLGVSQGHIVFALRTFFIGSNDDQANNDVIMGNPLLFNMVSCVDNLSFDAGRFYTMAFVGASTTMGQLNQFSKIYQMTITHSDGNLHKEVPQPKIATCSLGSRQEEDALQDASRKIRIDKSKPMKNLKEVFDAFAVELNQQKFTHAAQVQSWLSHVRNNYIPKMPPPIQTKLGGLPIDFFVHLDDVYKDYDVDNRNLPFEQPEQDQNKKGIRSIPVRTSTDVPVQVEKLMKLSRKIGQDAESDDPHIFKTIIAVKKNNNDRYEIHIVIKKIEVPRNKINVNTGPGESPLYPLEFVYQDPTDLDRDIISIQIRGATDVGLKVLEKQSLPTESLVVYGDREQITAERLPSEQFFQVQYSGLRAMVNPYENYGLESGVDASKIDDTIDVDLLQSTNYELTINGNPYLMFDTNRLPSDVINNKVGTAHYYKFPEYDPMYVKLIIYLKPHAALGITPNDKVNNRFFFQNYYHLYKVINTFENGIFLQQLGLLRGDEGI